jgi:uncharacterized membrane protein YphA (DoxX/SURF4 family)
MDGAPKGVPAREVLAYLCAVISLVAGIGLLWQRAAVVASRVLLTYLLVWLLLFRVPFIFRAPALAPSALAIAPSPGTSICNREGIAFRRNLQGGPCPDDTPARWNLPKPFFWNF